MQTKEAAEANTAPSDAEIAARIAAGDQSAFVLLMRRFNRPLYRAARSIVKDDAEAEDVLQEAYLRAYHAIGSFRGEAKLLTWLMRIVVNESIARSRKTARMAKIIKLDGTSANSHPEEHYVDDRETEGPEQAAMRAQARTLLENKIDALPEVFRTVFVLRALEEMTMDEISSCLNIPETTVRTRFFRARGLLREALAREFDFAHEDAFSFDGNRCDRIVANVLHQLR